MMKRIWFFLLILLLITLVLAPIVYIVYDIERKPPEDFFFGVSFGLKTASEAKLLIDKVKPYTNFFIVNSWDISTNETALNEVCDYAAEAGLSFIVFFDFISLGKYIYPFHDEYPWHEEWVLTAKDRWKDKFLGIYIYEEPGGKQIDTGLFDEFYQDNDRARMYENVTTYSEAADVFVTELPRGFSFHYLEYINIKKFVSDYALYWFDYLAGYDTVFVELGWNHSSIQHIGLCRGAATAQGKEWGAIITYTYKNPPYLASGTKILDEMLRAYEAGAKYVIVFNFPQYPENNPYGILMEEHFTAMQQFWGHIIEHQEDYGKTEGRVAFVLPRDYGWGMRRPDDNIWLPKWGPDNKSLLIWENMNKLIEKHGLELDIVYDDPRFNFENYNQVIFWNSTIN
jgi:hypothetical protein